MGDIRVLNIIVCIKQVPNVEEVYDESESSINRTKVPLILNPLDNYALSMALKLKEVYGGTVTTISMGPSKCRKVLKQVIATGADESILILGDEFGAADTYATAYTLANAIKKLKNYDLVITGNKSTDGDTGQVGPSIAEFLKISHITNVFQIQQINEGSISIRRKMEKEYLDVILPLPAVLGVTEDVCEITHPTISDIANSSKKEVLYWGVNDIDVDESKIGYKGSKTQVIRVRKVVSSKKSTLDYKTQKDDIKRIFQEIMKGIL